MSAGEADFGLEISRGVLAKFAMAAIGFAGSVLFARVLGPSGYGLFYLIVTLVNVLDNPVTGWGVACKKRISEADFSVAETLGSGLLGALLLSLLVLPVAYVFNQYTSLYNLGGLFLPFSGLFVVICFFAVTNRILSARANFSASEWADTLRSLFTTPLQLVFVAGLGMGTVGMVYGLAAATLLTVPYVLYQIGVRPEVPSRDVVVSIASYAKYSVPNGFIGTALSRMDILLLGALISSSAVGEYQVSMQLTMAGTFIGGVASAGLMARVSNHWSQENHDQIIEDVTNSLGYASVLAIPIFFGAAAMSESLLVTVFGAQYSGIGAVLVGLALYRLLSMQSSQLASTVSGLDRPDILTRIGLVALVLNISLGYVFLLEYGTAGVVLATIISEVVRYGALARVIKARLPELSLFTQPFRQQLLAGVMMFVVVDRLHAFLGVSWWGELVALVGVGAVVYFIVLIAISESFRVTIRGILDDAVA